VHCTRCRRPICPECMIPAPVGYQCPECVAQARREFRQGPGQQLRNLKRLSATRVLLVAIVAMFLVEVAVGGPNALFQGPPPRKLFDLGAMFPLAIAAGQYWRLFTAMFLHIGILHIAFNAYALYLFGRVVEVNLGRTRFLVIYFVTGFLASVASYVWGPITLAAGASGAIFGIFGAFIAYNYRRRHLAAASANLRWAFTLILLNAILAFSFSAIDWRAHVGGLVSGFAAGYLAEETVGPPRYRRAISVLGFVAMVAIGVLLIAWRTADLRSTFAFQG